MTVIPPPVAIWVLKHLVLGKRNEALEGDLLEEYQRRRSSGWYWRQVLWAMVLSFSRALSAGGAVFGTILFAGAWVEGQYQLGLLTANSPAQAALRHWLSSEAYCRYPVLIGMGIVFYVAAPLAIYLATARNLTRRKFLVGLGVGTVGLVIMLPAPAHPFPSFHPLSRFLGTFSDHLFAYARAEPWDVRLLVPRYYALQWSVPLLAGIAATKVSRSGLRTLPGALADTMKNLLLGTPRSAPSE